MLSRLKWLGIGLAAGFGTSKWIERRLRRQVERYLPANQLKAGAEIALRARDAATGTLADLRKAVQGGRSAMVNREAELRRQLRLAEDGGARSDGSSDVGWCPAPKARALIVARRTGAARPTGETRARSRLGSRTSARRTEGLAMEAEQTWGATGKQVLLTGATNGIGLAAAGALAARGANVAIVARDSRRAEQAAAQARAAATAAGVESVVDVLLADLSVQSEVRRLALEVADRYDKLDVLANNAGAIFAARQLTADGVERSWALNHLAPFLLTALLMDKLRASAPARVITTSSDASRGASPLTISTGSARTAGEAASGVGSAAMARRSSPTSSSRRSWPGVPRAAV